MVRVSPTLLKSMFTSLFLLTNNAADEPIILETMFLVLRLQDKTIGTVGVET